jgi:ATP-binding cassette subfamily F protein 3
MSRRHRRQRNRKNDVFKNDLGTVRELSGVMSWGAKTDIGYYSQQLEELDERNEIVQELRRVAPLADNGQLRGFLARFLFTGDDVFKKVSTLSGGEKGRLALAKLIYSNKNVLILDEPTNHLDIPSREALEAALEVYEGTIITVSHDRYFLDKVSTQILAFEADQKVEIFDGNYSQYHEEKEKRELEARRSGNNGRAATNAPAEKLNEVKVEDPKPKFDYLSKNQRQQIENRIKQIEKEIPASEAKLVELTAQMSVPEIAADHARLQKINDEFQNLEKQVQSLYAEWENYWKIKLENRKLFNKNSASNSIFDTLFHYLSIY